MKVILEDREGMDVRTRSRVCAVAKMTGDGCKEISQLAKPVDHVENLDFMFHNRNIR